MLKGYIDVKIHEESIGGGPRSLRRRFGSQKCEFCDLFEKIGIKNCASSPLDCSNNQTKRARRT